MKQILFSAFVLAFLAYACQKESLSSSDFQQNGVNQAADDRGGGGHHGGGHHGGGHHGGGHHPGDSLHLDSLGGHHCDSLHIDSTGGHHHHDSLHVHQDSTWTGGGGHHGGHHGGPGSWNPSGDSCHIPPAIITLAELPQAAQSWLAANQPGATILSVKKITKHDCTIEYRVKIKDVGVVRFDADGNKIN